MRSEEHGLNWSASPKISHLIFLGEKMVCVRFFFFFCVDGVPPDAFVFRRNNSGTLLQQATRESFAIIDSYTVVGVNLD